MLQYCYITQLPYCITAIVYFSIAYYGELQINDDLLEFYNGSNWGAVCTNGFNDDAGDVACKQLGYGAASNIYTYS